MSYMFLVDVCLGASFMLLYNYYTYTDKITSICCFDVGLSSVHVFRNHRIIACLKLGYLQTDKLHFITVHTFTDPPNPRLPCSCTTPLNVALHD